MSAAIAEAFREVKEIEDGIREFFEKVNGLLEWVPGFLEDLIQPVLDGLEWLNRKVAEFWAEIREFLDNTGNPDKLERHSEALINNVANPLTTISGNIAMEKLATNTEWTGSGAEAYKAIVPPQGDGLKDLRDLATDLGNTLKELANGIENFWIAMGFAFGALVVGIVAAIAEAATIVGAPAAIVTIAGAIGVALAAIGTAVMELKGIYDTIDTSQDTIDQGVTELGEEWARATPENQAKIENPGEWRPV